jgi:hypothetical protein
VGRAQSGKYGGIITRPRQYVTDFGTEGVVEMKIISVINQTVRNPARPIGEERVSSGISYHHAENAVH